MRQSGARKHVAASRGNGPHAPESTDIAVVLVLFEPDPDVVGRVDTYRQQVATVIAIDNTGIARAASIQAALGELRVDYLALGTNHGIAAALNIGCRRARELGYDWALMMDQDSAAPEGFVASLARCLDDPGSDTIAIVAPLPEMPGVTQPSGQRGATSLRSR